MEALNQKSLERVVSQRAFQMGSSFPCQICVVGFLCGVCLTSLFLSLLTSFGASSFGALSTSLFSLGISTPNSASSIGISKDCRTLLNGRERIAYLEECNENVSVLYEAWSGQLSDSTGQKPTIRLGKLNVPEAPHLENCKSSAELNQRLDTRLPNGSFPPWTVWKGTLDGLPFTPVDEQLKQYMDRLISQGAYPPWDQMRKTIL